ncbi:hypothetical protein [Actinoplanes sp. DH11]|uniref:hypothetical protein n=1 Tax=Actinoplanes sp. DH11 TaxID=2857011 RepID=UPI001E410699|nr:hypothetical protein [Actinoplanes sp. DH11]
MEDTGELTFQAQGDARLTKAFVVRLLLRVWGPMTLGVLAVVVVLVQAGVVTTASALTFGGVWLGMVAYQLWRTPRQTVEQNAHKLGRPTAYRIDATGVHAATAFGTEDLAWSTITGVGRTGGQIVLWLGWNKAYGIPSGGLTPAEQDRVLDVLRSRGRSLGDRPASPPD